MIGQSSSMSRIMGRIEQVARFDLPVLIIGESGTGKEVTARIIHELSRRKSGPFVPVNCAAIQDALIESELFGHEKGAFTGADRRHEGLFESARDGTLLLDEITEMRCETQAKLLRVLEEGKIRPVGTTREKPINVRVLATSNRQIDKAIREGQLREDLYFRLKVGSISLPPLRERMEELPGLVEDFVKTASAKHCKPIEGVDDDCINALARYRWPGNIRELKNAIEEAVVVCESNRLTVNDLASEIKMSSRPESSFTVQLGSSLREVEDEMITRTIAYTGNKSLAARMLGLGRRTIYTRLENADLRETNGRSNGRLRRNGKNGKS